MTPQLIIAAVAWLVSLLAATWALSRRSKNWDDAEDHHLTLYGDLREEKPGLVQQFKQLQDIVSNNTKHIRSLKKALNAHGSEEHVIVEAVAQKIADEAWRVQEEAASAARKKLIEDQNARFHTPAHGMVIDVEQPVDASPRRPALGPRPTVPRRNPVPRIDPEDPPTFDPEATGRNKRYR